MSQATDPSNQLSPLKRAFLTIEELQSRLAAGERTRREPIAIVGAGCRLPGGADSPDALWELLRDGADAIGEVPPARWDVDAYYDPDPAAPGKISSRHGGFLGAVDGFDPQFFGIAPREAASMDPQQRLLLEVAWEALENAGIAPSSLAGSRTGVFVGITSGDYAQLIMNARGVDGLDAYYASGIAHSIAAGRISYVLGLQGPSVALDTACSSSLVALHLAVQSLRSGESNLALAGGVNLLLSPETSITLSKYQMLAPDGRCKFGDASADGFVRAEGCGVVALKRLSDAQADGDRILAVIRGSAVNQDGASSGLTAPNGPAQEAVVRAALANAGLAPADVGYVEAHGTGTALGDPIEVQALGAVFGPGRAAEQPLLVGSIKSNLGHLEAAAGVTGLIKLALMLEHGQVPASLHFHTPSPHIAWDELPIRVPTALAPWQAPGRRVAGLSSFGFSGTNVHIVLEQAPAAVPAPAAVERPLHVLALSAAGDAALRELAARYARTLSAPDAPGLADVAKTANSGRSHLAHRLAVVAADRAAAAGTLAALAAGEEPTGAVYRHVQRADPPRVAFVFTGQGAQYPGMGRALYASQPVFRTALDSCAAILDRYLDRPLLDVLFAEPGSAAAGLLDQTAYTQPALVALECALAELWRSWGVTPAAVMGHSVGEYSAAIVAGVLSLEDGLALVATRGRLMQGLPAGGAMAAIFAPSAQVEAAVTAENGVVDVAAFNGPEHTVVSGAAAAVDALVEQFAAAGVRAQRLNVSHAFHSSLLDPMLEQLEAAAAGVTLNPPRLRLISNLTGERAGAEVTQPRYWRRHAREAVRFAQSVEQLARLGCDVLLEVGPHPTLLGMARAVLPEAVPGLPSLRKGRDDWQQMLHSLAQLYTLGAPVDWAGFDRPYARRRLALPTYPFQRERYWVAALPGATRAPRPAGGAHPLLGRRLRSALKQVQFEQTLEPGELAFVDDHRVFGSTILPAAGFAELALAAAQAGLGAAQPALDDLLIHAPLTVEAGHTTTLQTVLTPGGDSATVEVFSQRDGDEQWTLHAVATVRAARAPQAGEAVAELRERCQEPIAAEAHYSALAALSLELGPGLRSLRAIWRGNGEAVGELALPESEAADAQRYVLHPALLDACLQLLGVAAPETDATYLPIAVDRLEVYGRPGARAVAHARLLPSAGSATLSGTIRLFDEAGDLLAALDGLRLKRAEQLAPRQAEQDSWLYEVAWRPAPAAAAPDTAFLATPDAMAGTAHARIGALDLELDLQHYGRLIPELETLATDYIVEALHDLGWRPAPGERESSAGLAERLGVVPAQRALLNRLLAILAEDGLLQAAGDGWQVVAPPVSRATRGRVQALAERFPAARGDIETTRRCGEGLADALRGAADPLQLLFPGGSLATAEQLYRVSPLARAYTALLAEAAATAVAGLPAGRTLRVLEVGAGTGGATSAVLPRLDAARTSYTFTDISPLFLARARETFAAYPFVEYHTLDIEADPAAQGFDEHGYDVLIASNVIHATADLKRSFAHLQRLLAPGGVVLLLEMTAPLRWIDISFGLTEGWWRFSDRDLRPSYPLLSRDAWLDVLAELGFQQPHAVPSAGTSSAGLDFQHILIARGPRETAEAQTPRNVLIFADSSGVGERLAGLARAAGGSATLVVSGPSYARLDAGRLEVPTTSRDALGRLLGERPGPAATGWDDVVYLWQLDAAPDGATAGQQATLGAALNLARELVLESAGTRLWLVTRGAQPAGGTTADPQQATLWGFGKSLALEHPELRPVLVDLDPASDDAAAGLWAELGRGDEPEVALRGDERLAARLARTSVGAAAQPRELAITTRGALDNLELRPAQRRAPGAGEVEIRVAATGLNFRDVLNVLGMYPGDPGQPGSECAGTVVAVGAGVEELRPGDRVVALAGGSFRSYITVATQFVVPIPPTLSAAQAASFPIAYVTAAFALEHLGHIRAGERVLIHAAAGGVGLAAVRLAQRAGAEIFATAGSPAKREYLRSLGVRHVFDSRSLAFADDVRAATGGEGVDLVLNSLAGEFVPRSLELLHDGGRFLELGKRDHLSAAQAAALGDSISYHVIDWGDNARHEPELIRRLLEDVMAGAASGELAPLPLRTFTLQEAPAAFRYMAQARHTGKIVITQPDAGAEAVVRPDATYLITGGLGGLGLLTARRLVERGARHLALIGRSGAGAEARAAIAELERAGAKVLALRGDISRGGDVAAALERIAAELPPLRGVIHSAGVLDDGAITQQSWQRFERVLAPKVDGAWHLHTQTAGLELDFFVLYSSAAALLGSAGQTNHAAANSFLDALAHRRRAEGLAALSVNWGAWGEVGAAVSTGAVDRIGTQGIGEIAPAQGLALLERMLASAPAQVGVVPVSWPVFLRRFSGATPPFYGELGAVEQPAAAEPAPAAAGTPDLELRLAEAAPQRRLALLRDYTRDTTAHVLRLPAARIDDDTPLSAMGLDSLMAVELRNLLGAGLNLPRRLPATLVFDYPTVAAIADYLDAEVFGPAVEAEPETVPAAPADGAAVNTMIDELEDLSDDEIDRLLAEKLRA